MTRFDNARQFLCYAGLAPFDYTSGTSVRPRRKVSRMADRGIKSLLHMGALAVARSRGGDMKEYYLRKVAEGKNKMSVINAVRAKIAARMFSVARKEHPYQTIYTPNRLQQS